MCTLWQRFGRAARDLALDAIAILFVESSRTDANKEQKEARREKREAVKMKRKADQKWVQGGAAKRLAAGREMPSREGLNVLLVMKGIAGLMWEHCFVTDTYRRTRHSRRGKLVARLSRLWMIS
jgi:hypothetical protein